MRYFEILTEAVAVDSPQFKSWFGNSKVVDAQGNPLPVYHGTKRPDRVGTRFQKARATAGPMAYFTDSPEIASNYSTAKADTSITDTDYVNWFKIKIDGFRSPVSIDRAWHFLPHAERAEITRLAPMVTREEMYDTEGYAQGEYRYSLKGTNGLGSYDTNLKYDARGNPLLAMVHDWLYSGALHGDEEEFLKVLKMAGLTQPVIFDHPQAEYPFVYQVFLSIQNPLDTSNIPQRVIDALVKKGKRMRNRSVNYGDQWDKTTINPHEWVDGLMRDAQNDTLYTWTVIPDWATIVLKSFGYDGIKDRGGKYNPNVHMVWIPFEEHQVKSAISNKKFTHKSNIHR